MVIAFGAWAIWAMMHTIHAEDVEKEILPEEVLAVHEPVHPHLMQQTPTPVEQYEREHPDEKA